MIFTVFCTIFLPKKLAKMSKKVAKSLIGWNIVMPVNEWYGDEVKEKYGSEYNTKRIRGIVKRKHASKRADWLVLYSDGEYGEMKTRDVMGFSEDHDWDGSIESSGDGDETPDSPARFWSLHLAFPPLIKTSPDSMCFL